MSKLKTICLIAAMASIGLTACDNAAKNSSSSLASISSDVTSGISSQNSTSSSDSNSSASRMDPIQTYELTFKADNQDDVRVMAQKGNYTLPECMFTTPSYKPFKCWLVNGQEKNPGQVVNVTGPMVITAVFHEAQYKNDLNTAIEGLLNTYKANKEYTGPYTMKMASYYGETIETATLNLQREAGADIALGKAYEKSEGSDHFFYPTNKGEDIYLSCFTSSNHTDDQCFYKNTLSFTSFADDNLFRQDDLIFDLSVYLNHHDLFEKYIAYSKEFTRQHLYVNKPCESYTINVEGGKIENENKYTISLEMVEILDDGSYKDKFVRKHEFTFDYEKIYKYSVYDSYAQRDEEGNCKQEIVLITHYQYEYTFNEEYCDQLYAALNEDLIANAPYDVGIVPVYYKNKQIALLRDTIFEELTLDEISDEIFFDDGRVRVNKVSYNKDLSNPITGKFKVCEKKGPIYVDITFYEGTALLVEQFSSYMAAPIVPNNTFTKEMLDAFTNKEDITEQSAISNIIKPVKGESIPLHTHLVGLNLLSLKVNGVENKNPFFGNELSTFYLIEGLVETYDNCSGTYGNPLMMASKINNDSSKAVFNITGARESGAYYFAFKKAELASFTEAKVYFGNKYYYKDETINKSELTACTDSKYEVCYRYGDALKKVDSLSDIPADYEYWIYIEVSYGEPAPFTLMPRNKIIKSKEVGIPCAYLVLE